MPTAGLIDAPKSNPRRVAANKSVSLRHTQRERLKESLKAKEREQEKAKSSAASQSQVTSDSSSLLNQQNSSGETSNADRWFENSNHNVAKNGRSSFDNDSPFYLDNAVLESPHRSGRYQLQLPLRSQLAPFTSYGSSSEEYRSVIDDLTIENKKLKRRLQKYESLRDVHLKKERLFEVKIHGLSARKKRELEETLQKFASTLNASPSSEEMGTSSNTSRAVPLADTKAASSMASTRFADSGYGSLATSGQNSTLHTSHASRVPRAEATQIRDRSIHSFLHDIPEGLLPRHSTAMTEKAKKKLVVRRLEQIFGGRGAAPGDHQHSIQQQEVSHLAARAEQTAKGNQRRAKLEGIREAKIMDMETEDPMDPPQIRERREPRLDEHMEGISPSPSPEQRPTRPLDLDPDRAQVPEDNFEYIRHLGFLHKDGEEQLFSAGGDWVYLNILVNMAQLHTINVTTFFVKKAISEYSKRLELSSDGRKVRWRGESESHQESGNSSSGAELASSPSQEDSKKRTAPADFDAHSGHTPKKANLSPAVDNRFAYVPLFARQSQSDDDESDGSVTDTDSQSSMQGDTAKISSTFASSAKRSGSQARRDDGPIIFYQNASFCVDLSGDNSISTRPYTDADYVLTIPHTLGTVYEVAAASRERSRDQVLRDLAKPPQLDPLADDASFDIDFPRQSSSPKHVTFAEPEEPIPLEASGIGGVKPSDNFTATVLRQRRIVEGGSGVKRTRRNIPLRFVPLLKAPIYARSIADSILSDRVSKHAPPPLPPASMHFFMPGEDDEDGDSNDEDEDDEESGTEESSEHRHFTVHDMQPLLNVSRHSLSASVSEESVDPSDDGESETGSVDFLAAARAIMPDTIRAQEREYDAEVADRLAEEIPAGSSAATAGGGSGYASPIDGEVMEVDDQEVEGSVSS